MFKFLKSDLSEEEKVIFDVTITPLIIYSIINLILMALCNLNIGILNEDIQLGMLITYSICSLTVLFCIESYSNKNKRKDK